MELKRQKSEKNLHAHNSRERELLDLEKEKVNKIVSYNSIAVVVIIDIYKFMYIYD